MSNLPDHVYFNATFFHDPKYGNADSPAQVVINNPSPIIQGGDQYYLTIQRCSVPAFNLPIWIPFFKIGSNWSDNETIYTFNLVWKTFSSGPVNIIYRPQVTINQPYTGVVTNGFPSNNDYYYYYDFDHVCDLFTYTLKSAFQLLQTASGNTLPTSTPPIFYYNQSLNSIVLEVPQTGYDQYQPDPIYIYFGNQNATLFTGFSFQTISSNDPNGLDNYFVIHPNGNNLIGSNLILIPFSWTPAYYCPVQSFAITTTLSVTQEQVPPVNQQYGAIVVNQYPINPTNTSPILIDFVPDFSIVNNFYNIFIYDKTDSSRYIDFNDKTPVQSFILQAIWIDSANGQHQLTYPLGAIGTIKLLWIKKSLLNTNSVEVVKLLKSV